MATRINNIIYYQCCSEEAATEEAGTGALMCARAQAREHPHMRSVGGKARGTVIFFPVSRGARCFSRES
jgi:hypothetical protein